MLSSRVSAVKDVRVGETAVARVAVMANAMINAARAMARAMVSVMARAMVSAMARVMTGPCALSSVSAVANSCAVAAMSARPARRVKADTLIASHA